MQRIKGQIRRARTRGVDPPRVISRELRKIRSAQGRLHDELRELIEQQGIPDRARTRLRSVQSLMMEQSETIARLPEACAEVHRSAAAAVQELLRQQDEWCRWMKEEAIAQRELPPERELDVSLLSRYDAPREARRREVARRRNQHRSPRVH